MKFSRKANTGKTPSIIPDLPENVDDNFYLASAAKAAEVDKASGAYDEFLFSEDGLVQMPYERAVDDHLALVEMRLLDAGRRSVLIERHKLVDAEAKVTRISNREESLQKELDIRDQKLQSQGEILDGQKPGKANLFWPGTVPIQTSQLNGLARIASGYLLFFIVASVDIGLLFSAFREITGDTQEAILFSLPALGVQVAFPHFVGNRIAILTRKPDKVIGYRIEIAVMTIIWLVFATILTDIRLQFVAQNRQDDPVFQSVKLAFFFSLLFMLLGLGLWLMINEIRHNPHETAYARLLYSQSRITRKLEKLKVKKAFAEGFISSIEASLEVAEKSFSDSIQAARSELAEAAKSVYRRSLVNQVGTVDFTSAYLARTTSSSSGRSARRVKTDQQTADIGWRMTTRQKSLDLQDQKISTKKNNSSTTKPEGEV